MEIKHKKIVKDKLTFSAHNLDHAVLGSEIAEEILKDLECKKKKRKK